MKRLKAKDRLLARQKLTNVTVFLLFSIFDNLVFEKAMTQFTISTDTLPQYYTSTTILVLFYSEQCLRNLQRNALNTIVNYKYTEVSGQNQRVNLLYIYVTYI